MLILQRKDRARAASLCLSSWLWFVQATLFSMAPSAYADTCNSAFEETVAALFKDLPPYEGKDILKECLASSEQKAPNLRKLVSSHSEFRTGLRHFLAKQGKTPIPKPMPGFEHRFNNGDSNFVIWEEGDAGYDLSKFCKSLERISKLYWRGMQLDAAAKKGTMMRRPALPESMAVLLYEAIGRVGSGKEVSSGDFSIFLRKLFGDKDGSFRRSLFKAAPLYGKLHQMQGNRKAGEFLWDPAGTMDTTASFNRYMDFVKGKVRSPDPLIKAAADRVFQGGSADGLQAQTVIKEPHRLEELIRDLKLIGYFDYIQDQRIPALLEP